MADIPLKLKGSETTGPNSTNPDVPVGVSVYALQEMTSTEILDGIIYRILKEFAVVNRTVPKTGDLTLLETVGDVATALTGDYVDTTRTNVVGTRGNITAVSSINTVTTSVYQVLTRVSGSIVRPVCFIDGVLKEMTDNQIFTYIIDPAMNRMTNRGLGSYHFSVGAPRDPTTGNLLPGTWTSVFTLSDRYKTGTVANTSAQAFINNAIQPPNISAVTYTIAATSVDATTTYTLWRKTDETAPSSMPRPLKWANTAERGKHLAEMTNEDILTLLIPFRNAIIDDGRGRYKFQETGPTSGTWARRGDNVEDLLNVVGEGTYTWGYATSFTGAFTGKFASTSTGFYTRTSTGTYIAYFGDDNFWSGGSQASFVGYYSQGIAKYFTKLKDSTINRNYTRVTLVTYTTPVVGATTLLQGSDYLWVKRSN
jgi:hypothetical protein